MSCSTLSAQPIRLTVTVGNFPEGYCPANYQQFANDFAARLIVTPNQNNSTFVTGSTEPTSNVGPWLKNCEEWFVFNDATGRYRPETIGVFKNMRYYTSNDTFVVPDNIFKIKVHAWGAGGGGSNNGGGGSGSGGGGGAYGVKIFDVVPAQAVAISIGAGGGNGAAGANGGATTVLTLVASGGLGSPSTFVAGDGGTAAGADFTVQGGMGSSSYNVTTSPVGDGGLSTYGGQGGRPSPTLTLRNGRLPGGGGAGGIEGGGGNPSVVGGSGASGAVLIEY